MHALLKGSYLKCLQSGQKCERQELLLFKIMYLSSHNEKKYGWQIVALAILGHYVYTYESFLPSKLDANEKVTFSKFGHLSFVFIDRYHLRSECILNIWHKFSFTNRLFFLHVIYIITLRMTFCSLQHVFFTQFHASYNLINCLSNQSDYCLAF